MARRKGLATRATATSEPGDGEVAAAEVVPPPVPPAPAPVVGAKLDPLRPVRVANHGTKAWSGSDYVRVGPGAIPGGGVGLVTARKAEALVRDYADGTGGVGPFEILGG